MTQSTRSRRLATGVAAFLASIAALPARGDTVDASSTTMQIVRDQNRAGQLFTIAPLYELVSISARNVQNPVADDLAFVVSGWAGLSLGTNLVWYDANPPQHNLFGDLDLAFAQGELLKRSVQLRLGRQVVGGGVAGTLQLDGGSVLLRLPAGFGVTAYVGAPVAQRFHGGGSPISFNPNVGDFAVGGRAYWTLPRWGEIGFSGIEIRDRGDPGREQVGGDLRFTPVRLVTVLANSNYDLHEARWAEANGVLQFQLLGGKLVAAADVRHVEPDLLLSRTSILSVFSMDKRNEIGGSLQYGEWRALTFGADYHYLVRPDQGVGHRVNGRAVWQPRSTTSVGVEVGHNSFYTNQSGAFLNNGYFTIRGFASQEYKRFTGSLDLQDYEFQQNINNYDRSFTAIASLGYAIGCGWSALVSGDAGVTPYYQSRYGLMVRLAYNQSYHFREVR